MIFTILSLANPDMGAKKGIYLFLAIVFGLPLAFFLFPSFGNWFTSLFVVPAELVGFSLPVYEGAIPSILSNGFDPERALETSLVASALLWVEEFAVGISAEFIGAIFRDKSGETKAHDMFDEAG